MESSEAALRGPRFVYLIPVILYFWYTIRVLPGLRMLKHSFRGMSYVRAARFRQALAVVPARASSSIRRAGWHAKASGKCIVRSI